MTNLESLIPENPQTQPRQSYFHSLYSYLSSAWTSLSGCFCWAVKSADDVIDDIEEVAGPKIKQAMKEVAYPILEEIARDSKPVISAIADAVQAGNSVLLVGIITECMPYIPDNQKAILAGILTKELNKVIDHVEELAVEKADDLAEHFDKLGNNNGDTSFASGFGQAIADSGLIDDAAAKLAGVIQEEAKEHIEQISHS
ncbi:MAG: hypothetical protein SFT91_02770 [Rickettsiaceae bacterium]|nr:hypothetical protein [Rickettsiaceae bacterium]